MNQVDICHFITTFNLKSGAARRTIKIAEESVKAGFSVSIVCGEDNDAHLYEGPVPITVIKGLRKKISLKHDCQSFFAFKQYLKSNDVSVLHTHLAKAGILGRLVAGFSKIQCKAVLHTVHGPTFDQNVPFVKRKLFLFLEKLAARYTDKFVFVGEELREQYVTAGVCLPENTVVIRSGKPNINKYVSNSAESTSVEPVKVELINDEPIKILYLARIVESKQHKHAIDLLKLLLDDGHKVQMYFAGEALVPAEKAYEAQLKDYVSANGLDSNLTFLGHVNKVDELIRSVHFSILPSKYEGLPNFVLESMLNSVPIVTYEVLGVKELLGKGLHNELICESNPQAMFRLLTAAMQNYTDLVHRVSNRKNELIEMFADTKMCADKNKLYKSYISTQ